MNFAISRMNHESVNRVVNDIRRVITPESATVIEQNINYVGFVFASIPCSIVIDVYEIVGTFDECRLSWQKFRQPASYSLYH